MITYNQYSWLRFLGNNDISWNDLTNFCNGEKWCYPVDDKVLSRFQLRVGLGAELISNIDFSTPLASGNVTDFTVNKLRDSGATFLNDKMVQSMTAVNKDTDVTAGILAIDTDILITLNADIFTSPDLDLYEISGWLENTGWEVNRSGNPGVALAQGGAISSLQWGQAILTQGRNYKLVYTISTYSDGTCTPQFGSTAGTARNTTGTFTEYVSPTDTGLFAFKKNATGDFEISDVSIKEVDDVVFVIRNETTGATEKILDIDVDFFYSDQTIRVQLNWNTFNFDNDTCHDICTYLDSQEEISDFSFNDISNGFSTDWTVPVLVNATGVFEDGTFNYNATGGGNNATLRNNALLVQGQQYIVRYKLSDTTDIQVQAFCGSGGIGQVRTTDGTFVELITCATTSIFEFQITGSTADAEVVVEWASVYAVGNEDRCTECFHYLEEQTAALIYIFDNDEDAFGFDYESGPNLQQEIMLTSRIGKENFPEELEDHLDSAGLRTILFGQSREQRELIYGEMPSWVHRAMAKAWLHDEMLIEETPLSSIEYSKVPSDWEPDWVDFRNIAGVIIDVSVSDQANDKNANC